MNAIEAVLDLNARGRLLIGLDFDGTLAPLVDHPDDAIPEKAAMAQVRELLDTQGIRVAIVSGRSLADLRERLGEDLPGAVLIGEHGNDTGEDPADDDTLDAAAQFVDVLKGDRDVVVERKSRSVTFHTRNLDRHDAEEAVSLIRTWAGEHPDVTLLEGKEVLELTVATQTKGDAIVDLADAGEGVLYIGDDTTDETVFAMLGPDDVGVKVGPGPTAARFRVKNVAEVVELLEALALASR